MYNVPYFNEGCKFELETLHFRYFIIKQILIATFCTWYDSNWPPLIFLLSQETSNVRQLYFGNCDEFITVVFPLINLHWADVLWLSRRYFVIFCSKQPIDANCVSFGRCNMIQSYKLVPYHFFLHCFNQIGFSNDFILYLFQKSQSFASLVIRYWNLEPYYHTTLFWNVPELNMYFALAWQETIKRELMETTF